MTQTTPPASARAQAVQAALERIAAHEQRLGATREGLRAILDEVLTLAGRAELFVRPEEFQPAVRGTFKDFVAYRLNPEDPSGRALYVSLTLPGKESPPHNHKNWAVLAGLRGVEENRLYARETDGGFRQIDSVRVGPGKGLALLGEDIHSIHVEGQGDEPVWQLRFYERALELQTDREQFDPDNGATASFAPNRNVKAVA